MAAVSRLNRHDASLQPRETWKSAPAGVYCGHFAPPEVHMVLRRAQFIASCTALLIAMASAAPAKDKPKSDIPRMITHARFVMVTTLHGNGFAGGSGRDLRVPPEDLRALTAVEDALRAWGRYTLVQHERDAELIFLVRAGRIAEVGGRP